MPTNTRAGVSASLCYPVYDNDQRSIMYQPVLELGLARSDDGEHATWCRIPPSAQPRYRARVYFTRELDIVPLIHAEQGPEVYAVYLTMKEPVDPSQGRKGGGPAFVKYFAIGKGVGNFGPNTPRWFLDGHFGEVPRDLNDLRESYIELRFCRATLKLGVPPNLGDGLLDPDMIAEIDVDSSVCVFKWHYATEQQLQLIGMIPSSVPFVLPRSSSALALDFLRKTNELLISLLTPTQKREFVESIMDWQELKTISTETGAEKFEGRGEGGEGIFQGRDGQKRLSALLEALGKEEELFSTQSELAGTKEEEGVVRGIEANGGGEDSFEEQGNGKEHQQDQLNVGIRAYQGLGDDLSLHLVG
ncbi:hypothetical protein JCM16303_001949 [Sporobolomyces ruberrimus]